KSKTHEARLVYMGHALMENRSGLAVDVRLTTASGKAEREAALEMIDAIPGSKPITLGADKAYDTREMIAELRVRNVVPHVASNAARPGGSAIDGRTTRHSTYHRSQRKRKRIEEIFGWLKTVGSLRKTRHRGRALVDWMFTFSVAIYNLVRIRNLTPEV